jgi:hypothetical protein
MYALLNAPVDQYNLSYKAIGLAPSHYGFMFAAASILAAAVGFIIHHLERLSLLQYMSLETASTLFAFVSFAYFRSLPITIIAFMINMIIFRFQRILYQHYLVQIYGTVRYKATLLSLATNFGQIHQLWLVILFTGIANQTGLLNGYYYMIGFVLVLWPVLLYAAKKSSTIIATSRVS